MKGAPLKFVVFFGAQAGALRFRPLESSTAHAFREYDDVRIDAHEFRDPDYSKSHMQAIDDMKLRQAWPVRNLTKYAISKAWGKTFNNRGHETYNCVVPPAGHKYDFCPLKVCTQGKPKSPRVFVEEHVDGEGHRLMNAIRGMVVAKRYGLQFGGMIDRDGHNVISDHHHEFGKVLESFFGTPNHKLLWYGTPPCFDTVLSSEDVGGKENLTSLFFEGFDMDTGNIFVPDVGFLASTNEDLDLAFELRKPLAPKVSFFNGKQLSVAIHVRRDDLVVGNAPSPNEYFNYLIDVIRELYPDANIHMWSSIGVANNYKTSDFDDFLRHGVHLHLDTDIVEAWAHMSHADVFMAEPSSFSRVPLEMNPNCVLQHEKILYLQDTEITFTNLAFGIRENSKLFAEPSFKDKLQMCISGKRK